MKFVLASLVVVAACGSKAPAPATTTTPPSTAPAAKPALPDVPFDQLDHAQRKQYMEEVVVPTMKPIFQNHNAKKFAEFGCETCHGAGAKDAFKMPNGELPKLDFGDMSKFEKADVEWMTKEVKPTMAKLVKEPEMTKDNPKGFGCLECHTMAGGS